MRKRIIVTGRDGQVVRCLLERGLVSQDFEVIAIGRPDLDLTKSEGIFPALRDAKPDIIVSAAAYTAVDQAESEPDLVWQINAVGAESVAQAAALLNVPIIHLSTDYVFDGSRPGPYIETNPVAPLGVYGRSKLAGEELVALATPNHVILRTAWVYSPYGKNFVKTMLRLAETRDSINVVEDQIGNPTSALDIADGILVVARNLLDSDDKALRGTFHMTSGGIASWASFAAEIFRCAKELGASFAEVIPIPTSAYPTPAKRPANSQLDCSKLWASHRVSLPDWRESASTVVSRILSQ